MESTEDGSNYKYFVFYYNKNDNSIIVPKRAKLMGWTFNFAHPASYLIMTVLAIVIIWAIIFKK